MNTETLELEMRAAGLVTLAVSSHPSDPTVAVVYLNGPAGQWANGYAVSVIMEIPGVKNATESIRTPAIVLVWMDSP